MRNGRCLSSYWYIWTDWYHRLRSSRSGSSLQQAQHVPSARSLSRGEVQTKLNHCHLLSLLHDYPNCHQLSHLPQRNVVHNWVSRGALKKRGHVSVARLGYMWITAGGNSRKDDCVSSRLQLANSIFLSPLPPPKDLHTHIIRHSYQFQEHSSEQNLQSWQSIKYIKKKNSF